MWYANSKIFKKIQTHKKREKKINNFKNMLTDEDIKKLIEVFATREEVATKQDLEGIRQDFVNLPNP